AAVGTAGEQHRLGRSVPTSSRGWRATRSYVHHGIGVQGDTINLFMWGFQRGFRSGVENAVSQSIEELGASVSPAVFLVGVLKEGGAGHPLCIEPEDGPLVPEDFVDLDSRAA